MKNPENPENLKHGELTKDGSERWCETCDHTHGHGYTCKHYPIELQKEIKLMNEEFKNNLKDKNWVNAQINNGIPPEAIEAYKFFMGIKE